MKTILLAAGKGTRLKGVSKGIPKVMLVVSGKTILERNLGYLKKYGVSKVIINLHYKSEMISNFLREKDYFGMDIVFSYEPELLGTAGAVKRAEFFLKDNDFLVLYGDNLLDFDINKLSRYHKHNKAIGTLGVFKPDETRYSGIAAGLISSSGEGRVARFSEKRNNKSFSKNDFVNAGIGIFSPKILERIPKNKYYDFGKDLFPKLLKTKCYLQILKGASYVFASDTLQAWNRTKKEFCEVNK